MPRLSIMLAVCCAAALNASAFAQGAADPVPESAKAPAKAYEWSAEYLGDTLYVASGGARDRVHYLDNLLIGASLDFDALFHWRGAKLSAQLLSNHGGRPNEDAGTLEGVDNIEVAKPQTKLFELYLDQAFAGGAGLARVGFFDLNAEFYHNEAAGLLTGPAFGIGSELSSTGPNGPSIFPSTALGIMVRGQFGERFYAEAAALNAVAGVLGDPGGINTSFADGVLAIGEAGYTHHCKLALGLWAYTRPQDDIRDTDPLGLARRRRAMGAYLLAEHAFAADPDQPRATSAFLRLGISDGQTTPFAAGAQTGVRVSRVFARRAQSEFSLGLRAAKLNPRARANLRDGGGDPAAAEWGVELTYADKVIGPLRLQPVVAWSGNPGGLANARSVWLLGLRFGFALGAA